MTPNPDLHPPMPPISTDQLRAWAAEPLPPRCPCGTARHRAWTSFSESQWPASMDKVGTLRDEQVDEPTFEELHPDQTSYDSPDAPLAIGWFPYNRCDVYRCRSCGVYALRYTEFGGYYVDHRVRCLHGLQVIAPG